MDGQDADAAGGVPDEDPQPGTPGDAERQHPGDAERRRLQMLRRLGVVETMHADPDPAWGELVRLACLATGSTTAAVLLVDDHVRPLAALGGEPQITGRPGTLADEVVHADAPATRDDEGCLRDPQLASLGARSALAVPLRVHGQVIGALVVADQQPVEHSARAVEALELVAGRVAAQLELRRVRTELALELGARDLTRRTDEVTGLPLRRALHERAVVEIARDRRHGTGLVVAVLDLDGSAGDDTGLLQRVAAALTEIGRAPDLVGRWEGDRFVVLLPDTTSRGAGTYLRRVRDRVLEVDGGRLRCLIGAVPVGPGTPTLLDALVEAERALAEVREGDGEMLLVAPPVPVAGLS